MGGKNGRFSDFVCRLPVCLVCLLRCKVGNLIVCVYLSAGLIPLQQQQGFPMVQVMQPNMQGMMGMNFGAQMPPGAMPIQVSMNHPDWR